MKKNRIGLAIFILLAGMGFLFSSCSDDPGLLGQDLVAGQELGNNVITVDSQSVQAYTKRKIYGLAGASYLLMGKAGNTEVLTLLKYKPLWAGMKDSLLSGAVVIDSAAITMEKLYTVGGTSDSFAVKVNPLRYAWNDSSIVSKDLAVYSNNPITYWNNDSISIIGLDLNVAKKWVVAAEDTNAEANNGLFFVPKSYCTKIQGYQALTSSSYGYTDPLLTYKFRNTSTNVSYIKSFDCDADRHVLNLIDTNTVHDSTVLYVQEGMVLNSFMTFDISKLPTNCIINYAELTLNRRTDLCVVSSMDNYTSTLKAAYVKSIDSTLIDPYLQAGFSVNGDVYTGNVTSIVGTFYNAKNSTVSIMLFSSSGAEGADVVAFHNKTAIYPLRPKLKIYYTVKGQQK
ncbi:MAG: hypothetical protein LWX56_02710 [Ignavibacteria bacterium]|nr:hypothetical protein [Ignavibacteria bacterium]